MSDQQPEQTIDIPTSELQVGDKKNEARSVRPEVQNNEVKLEKENLGNLAEKSFMNYLIDYINNQDLGFRVKFDGGLALVESEQAGVTLDDEQKDAILEVMGEPFFLLDNYNLSLGEYMIAEKDQKNELKEIIDNMFAGLKKVVGEILHDKEVKYDHGDFFSFDDGSYEGVKIVQPGKVEIDETALGLMKFEDLKKLHNQEKINILERLIKSDDLDLNHRFIEWLAVLINDVDFIEKFFGAWIRSLETSKKNQVIYNKIIEILKENTSSLEALVLLNYLVDSGDFRAIVDEIEDNENLALRVIDEMSDESEPLDLSIGSNLLMRLPGNPTRNRALTKFCNDANVPGRIEYKLFEDITLQDISIVCTMPWLLEDDKNLEKFTRGLIYNYEQSGFDGSVVKFDNIAEYIPYQIIERLNELGWYVTRQGGVYRMEQKEGGEQPQTIVEHLVEKIKTDGEVNAEEVADLNSFEVAQIKYELNKGIYEKLNTILKRANIVASSSNQVFLKFPETKIEAVETDNTDENKFAPTEIGEIPVAQIETNEKNENQLVQTPTIIELPKNEEAANELLEPLILNENPGSIFDVSKTVTFKEESIKPTTKVSSKVEFVSEFDFMQSELDALISTGQAKFEQIYGEWQLTITPNSEDQEAQDAVIEQIEAWQELAQMGLSIEALKQQFGLGEDFKLIRKIAEGGFGAVFQVEHKGELKVIKCLKDVEMKYEAFAEAYRVMMFEAFTAEDAPGKAAVLPYNVLGMTELSKSALSRTIDVSEVSPQIQGLEAFVRDASQGVLSEQSIKGLFLGINPETVLVEAEFIPDMSGFEFYQEYFAQKDELIDSPENYSAYQDFMIEAFFDIGSGLELLHQNGIIHRDIKPENIFLNPEAEGKEPKGRIADPGLASFPEKTLENVMGTVGYISPEQYSGQGLVEPKHDVFALGVSLYTLLSLENPFITGDASLSEKIKSTFVKQALPMRGIDSRLDEVVAKAMAKDPELRYQTMAEFINDLQAVKTKPEVSAEEQYTADINRVRKIFTFLNNESSYKSSSERWSAYLQIAEYSSILENMLTNDEIQLNRVKQTITDDYNQASIMERGQIIAILSESNSPILAEIVQGFDVSETILQFSDDIEGNLEVLITLVYLPPKSEYGKVIDRMDKQDESEPGIIKKRIEAAFKSASMEEKMQLIPMMWYSGSEILKKTLRNMDMYSELLDNIQEQPEQAIMVLATLSDLALQAGGVDKKDFDLVSKILKENYNTENYQVLLDTIETQLPEADLETQYRLLKTVLDIFISKFNQPQERAFKQKCKKIIKQYLGPDSTFINDLPVEYLVELLAHAQSPNYSFLGPRVKDRIITVINEKQAVAEQAKLVESQRKSKELVEEIKQRVKRSSQPEVEFKGYKPAEIKGALKLFDINPEKVKKQSPSEFLQAIVEKGSFS